MALIQYLTRIQFDYGALDTLAAIRDVVVRANDADDTLMYEFVLEEATAVDLILSPKP